jgi:putative endopeptidase
MSQRIVLRLGAVAALLGLAVFQVRASASSDARSGIDLAAIDRTCKPCADFYEFANGAWLKTAKIPPDKSYYGSFNILSDENRAILHEILDDVVRSNAPQGSNERKLADYYSSCMDTEAIDAAGTAPLAGDFAAIASISDLSQLPMLVAQLQLDGVDAFFDFARVADFQDSAVDVAGIDQGGLGLPDRDYYTRTDAKSVELRAQYVSHVRKMFVLLGESDVAAAADAATVMAIETALARHQLSYIEEIDVNLTDNRRTLAQLDAISPNFSWSNFVVAAGVRPTATDVTSPAYLSALSAAVRAWNLDQIKSYLRWQLLNAYAAALPKPFHDENFAFYSMTLQGEKQPAPRWKECVNSVDENLGDALGRLYVARVFPPEAKTAAVKMLRNILSTFREDLSSASWMSPITRRLALEKLDGYLIKIGYPEQWRDYSNLTIARNPYAANLMAARRFELQREFAQIGGPVDRTEWSMTPPTVNAYYEQTVNQIVFPAGILQPPFFDASADPAVNYGAIGGVIGHEATHGFDDQGSLFDKNGELNDQWTAADSATFDAKTQCIVDQFDTLSPLPGVKENGRLVAAEETADLGGVTLAYRAFEKWQSTHPRRIIDGFTPEQRFFLGWAHLWMSRERPEAIALAAQTDVHAYDKFRVNATLSNIPAFAQAWMCPLGSAMVRPAAERCQIW